MNENRTMLKHPDWDERVRRELNAFLFSYGKSGALYSKNSYAVFDFDNTTSIFDTEEILALYQLQVMAFSLTPESLKRALSCGIDDLDKRHDSERYGFHGTYRELIGNICHSYRYLWTAYGPFTAKGLPSDESAVLMRDPEWNSFAAGMRFMYELICAAESAETAYCWLLYWFTGMQEQEVYELAGRCFAEYGNKETASIRLSGKELPGNGLEGLSIDVITGISVTENMRELWQALSDNGIDVWVCSASFLPTIRAAVDFFGLRDFCCGVLAMDLKKDGFGNYLPEGDPDASGIRRLPDHSWERMDHPAGALPYAEGKVTAIANVISPIYGENGPVAGFMDSSGDFQFCTEFSSLKLVMCLNRADNLPTEGGGLIAAIAELERTVFRYDLLSANAAGDILYLLQGRDENGMRSFRPSPATVRYKSAEPKLFAMPENSALLESIRSGHLSVKNALQKYAVKEKAGQNGLDFETGFLDDYRGYRSI